MPIWVFFVTIIWIILENNCLSIGYLLIPCSLLFSATAYGHGTYFAVNASYSANPTYSRPAADGSQLMFVARVLTGLYTQGQSSMRVPPPLNDQQPHDRYDSVVDKLDNPSMYVVFHDNQAYPDYLITFKWLWGKVLVFSTVQCPKCRKIQVCF